MRANSQRQRRQRSAIGRIGRRSVARRKGTTDRRTPLYHQPPRVPVRLWRSVVTCAAALCTGPSLLHTPLPAAPVAPGAPAAAVAVPLIFRAPPTTSAHSKLHYTIHRGSRHTNTTGAAPFVSHAFSRTRTDRVCVLVYRSGFWPNFLSAHGHTRAA